MRVYNKEFAMSFTLFSFVVLTVFLLLCLWQVYYGFKNGALASLSRLAVIFFSSFVSAIVAFILSGAVDDPILEWIYETPFYMTLEETFGSASIIVSFLLNFLMKP